MLENLINLVRENAGSAVINNPAIPNEQNEAVVNEAGHSILDSLQQMVSQGKLQDVLHMFQGGGSATAASSPAVQNISGNFIQSLISKFGINPSTASDVAGNLVPNVLQNLVHKTNDPNDSSFDLQSIISHLSGSGGGGIQDILGNLTQGGAGGVVDKIKGLFGN